jgi:hypothetical protein
MILKLLVVGIVIFFVYKLLFKKSNANDILSKKDKEDEVIDTMVECPTCNVLLSKDEAILSNAQYYCSAECLNK